MERQTVIRFAISIGKYQTFVEEILNLSRLKKSAIVCVANTHMYIEAYKAPDFLQIINNADLVTPDGRPLIWALKQLYNIKQDRVAGMDLLPDLLEKMALQNISVYFYGSTEAMMNNTKIYLEDKYPKLKIAGLHSPPFGQTYDENIEEKEIIDTINKSYPSIVFVVLGCPKQEKWMASMKDKIHTVMIGIGGALPVMLGMQKRAPMWMQNSGLEWLFRLSLEPRRLFRRYVSTNSLFLWIFFKEYLKVRILKPMGF